MPFQLDIFWYMEVLNSFTCCIFSQYLMCSVPIFFRDFILMFSEALLLNTDIDRMNY